MKAKEHISQMSDYSLNYGCVDLHIFHPQSLLSCVAFGYGCENFAKYEQQGIGIHWYNMNKSPEEGERYTFTVSIIMMLFDAVLYWVLTWYIENVFPGRWISIMFAMFEKRC